MSRMRADPWASLVTIGICQPCHDRDATPMPCSAMASSPELTCSPDATTASYSRASCRTAASRHHSISRLVVPAMAETTTAISLPASTSRLTCRATLRMRSMFSTEVPPNFITRRPMRLPRDRWRERTRPRGEHRRKKAGIHTGAPVRSQPRGRSRASLEENGDGRTDCPGPQRRSRGSRAVFRARRRVLGPARQDAHAAPAQSAPAALYPRPCLPAFRPRGRTPALPRGAAHARHRLRRRVVVGTAGPARRRGRRRGPRAEQHRGRAPPRGRFRRCGRLSRRDRRGARRCGRELRPRAGHGSGRARRRRRGVREQLRRDGEAEWPDDRGDHQSHAEKLRARDRGRRVSARLAAARHPSLGQIGAAERARGRHGRLRPALHRAQGRRLRSLRRCLEALRGYRRELHGRRRPAGLIRTGRAFPFSAKAAMIDMSWLWAVFTVTAAAAQTARNAMQRELTARLGTVGATHVRFLFGCPFALVFLAAVLLAKHAGPPATGIAFWLWVFAGALSQILATALM